MPLDPLAKACFTCLLCFAQYKSQVLFYLDWKLVTKISGAAYESNAVYLHIAKPALLLNIPYVYVHLFKRMLKQINGLHNAS